MEPKEHLEHRPPDRWWGNQTPPDREEEELVERMVEHHPTLTKHEALRQLRLW